MTRRQWLSTMTLLPALRAQSSNAGLDLPQQFRAERVLDVFSARADQRYVLAELEGPGAIRHIWVTSPRNPMANRRMILRMYWDGETKPSVEAPLGDFFGVCHGLLAYPINSLYLSVQDQTGYNCYFPMPFAKSARLELDTGPVAPGGTYYHIDWHRYRSPLTEPMRFHAAWRREFPAQSYGEEYTILDAVGRGRLLGFIYGVRLYDNADRWSHGGAENIYIDGETTGEDGIAPGYIRGSGGEDTFGTSYGGALHKPESNLYVGMPYYVHEDFGGGPRPSQRVAAYRFYENDAIPFERSLHFRFGCMANDICSTAYWYQTEPHRPFVRMPAWEKLAPATELRRGEMDLLVQTGASGPDATLASPQDGEWWLCGAFENEKGEAMNRLLPPEEGVKPDPAARYDGQFGPESPWRYAKSQRPDQVMAHWVKQRAVHGFIDFTHAFRPWTKGVSVCWPAAACAQTSLVVDRDTAAKLFVAWDDRAILRLNDEPPRDLGHQSAFRQRALDVRLKRGANRLVIKINNTKGTTWGAWCFNCRVRLPDGREVIPAAGRK
jgi:hypothetical protein